jgi:1-acyl-sn-glycerol-3-phosphate acyltransferase
MLNRDAAARPPEKGALARAAAAMLTTAGYWLVCALCRVRVEGTEHVPRSGGFILVGNHVNPLEAPLVGGAMPRRDQWVAISEHLRLRPWIARLLGVIYNVLWLNRMDGRDHLLRAGVPLLADGKVIVLMPEGRYGWTGRLGAADDGSALLALAAGAVVVPVATVGLENVGPALARGRRAPVALRFGKPFTLAEPAGGIAEATGVVMREIARLLPPEKRGRWQLEPGVAEDALR